MPFEDTLNVWVYTLKKTISFVSTNLDVYLLKY